MLLVVRNVVIFLQAAVSSFELSEITFRNSPPPDVLKPAQKCSRETLPSTKPCPQEDEEVDGAILQMMFEEENGDDILAESLKTKKYASSRDGAPEPSRSQSCDHPVTSVMMP